jgi:hypothetical protein
MMKNGNKIILLLAIIAVISLAAYCFYVKGLTHRNEIFISELESRLHETTDKLAETLHVIKILGEDYKSYNEVNSDLNYLAYKETVSHLLDKNISTIVNQRPMHGGDWFVSKVDFISPLFAIVKYEDGHEFHVALIQILKTDEAYSFQIVN